MGWFSNSKFAFCRGIANHAWRFPPELSHEGKQLALTLQCDHCGAKRKDRVSFATGAVETRIYAYAEGYLLDLQGEKRPEKAELRKDGLALLVGEAKRSNVRRLRPRRKHAA
jgi:hypothetical protein